MDSIRCILVFCVLSINLIGAQTYNKDSVLSVIKEIRSRPINVEQANQLRSLGYDLIELDSALAGKLLKEALQKSITVKDKDAIANAYRLLGVYHSYFEDYDDAMRNYRLSHEYATANQNSYLSAGVLYNMANIKYWKGEYDSCIHYYTRSLRLFENPKILKEKDVTVNLVDRRLSDIYSNMSQVFNTLKNLKKADFYIDKAIAIDRKYDSEKAKQVLAFHMQQKADNFDENNQYRKALQIRLKFLPEIEKSAFPKIYVQQAYQAISQEYYNLGKIDSSQINALKSLKIAEEIKTKSGLANANKQLGEIALQQKKYEEAEHYLSKTVDYFTQSEDPAEKRNFYKTMHELYAAKGKFREAYQYFKDYSALNDSLLSGEKATQFAELEAKYESEKKDNQIKLQESSIKRKNILNYALFALAAALLMITALGFRTFKQRQKIQKQRITELETEKQLTATEAVLKGEEQERTRLAKDLHDGLGGMLSGIKLSLNHMKGNLIMTPENADAFERSIGMLDNTIKEMRRVAHNMMPEMLVKYGLDTALKELCNEVNRSGSIQANYQSIEMDSVVFDQSLSVAVYRIVQELVGNAIKHSSAKNLLVQAHVDPDERKISVTVEDDGLGFTPETIEENKGMGWNNIRHRIEFLKGKIDVKSAPNQGTSVLMEINLV